MQRRDQPNNSTSALIGPIHNVNAIRINHLNLETTTPPNLNVNPKPHIKTKYAFNEPSTSAQSTPQQQSQSQSQTQQQQQSFRMGAAKNNLIDFQFPVANATNNQSAPNMANNGPMRIPSSKLNAHAHSLRILNDSSRFLEDIINAQSKRTLAKQTTTNTNTNTNSSTSGSSGGLSASLQLPASITIINRTSEERALCPDKLIMERKSLAQCPVIEGEDAFKLINYQHNHIKQIQNLDQMRNLIFLDLYNNQIEKINGLCSLINLRVLMLGKNRILKIENLNSLVYLDILDLHGNLVRVPYI